MIHFYKPNPKVTGTACSFWLNRDGSIMGSMIKQDSWNEVKKIGSFSKNKDNPQARVIIKFSKIEIAGIVDALEREVEFKTYHTSQNQILQVLFRLYLDKVTGEKKGFSFSINKQQKDDSTAKTGFIIGFNYPEARLLRHELLRILTEALYADDAAKDQSNRDEKSAPREEQAPARPQQQQAAPQKPTAQSGEEDLW
jgi:hypothetical protein